MKKLNDKKISVLAATALTVSLVMPTVQMIPAEETEVLDQYMIIELEPIVKPEVDVQETENSSEEQSTEEFSEVVSESDTGVNVLANAEISNLLPIQHTSQILLDPLAVILACSAAGAVLHGGPPVKCTLSDFGRPADHLPEHRDPRGADQGLCLCSRV